MSKERQANEVLLCKDCKWARVGALNWLLLGGYRYAACHKWPMKKAKVSLVTGETKRAEYNYCSVQRKSYGNCGPEGRGFEPRG